MKLLFSTETGIGIDNIHTEKICSTGVYTDIFIVNIHIHIYTHIQWDCSNNGMSMCYSSKNLSFKFI